MHFKFAVALVYTFLSVASAATYNVSVGMNNEDDYEPRFLTGVQSGDTIRFSFVSQIPHSVTESTFDQPCTSKSSGLDSGVLTSPSEWSTPITNISGPLWFYCNVGTHCSGSGMVFAINPTGTMTFDAFRAKAVGGTGSSAGGSSSTSGSSTVTSGRTSSTGNVQTSQSSSISSSTSRSPSAATDASSSPSPTSGGIKISIHETSVALAFVILYACLSL